MKRSQSALDGVEKEIVRILATGLPFQADFSGELGTSPHMRVMPGDICALLLHKTQASPESLWGKTSYICVLVNRFWRQRAGEASKRLLRPKVQAINKGPSQS